MTPPQVSKTTWVAFHRMAADPVARGPLDSMELRGDVNRRHFPRGVHDRQEVSRTTRHLSPPACRRHSDLGPAAVGDWGNGHRWSSDGRRRPPTDITSSDVGVSNRRNGGTLDQKAGRFKGFYHVERITPVLMPSDVSTRVGFSTDPVGAQRRSRATFLAVWCC